ncbi:MAG TPA: hypothetical protein ENH87_03300 [Pricia antarctica]|uniref:Glutamyl-tRNA synthetase n=1 Tax=Pricia antarctica TaxID=641691 RepID=A0A831QKE4_9FLAO|nr:hypothetical protein [Pricia antarctica]
MSNYDNILVKLDKFTKKFYSKMLIKGALLFVVLGVLFFFVVLGVEYFLWLNSTGRLLLLFVFFSVEGFLLFRYILTPLFYLFKLRNGISNKDASLLIGTHFPNVGDKLYNLLELTEDTDQSELLLASIEQRSQDMHLIPFTKAIDLKDNLKYTKYLAIPIILLSLIWLSGNIKSFFGSANRVVNYDMAYEPPAPFRFRLLSSNLDILESEPHTIEVITEGEVQPEAVYLDIKGKMTLLKKINNNYQYTFSPPLKNTDFSFVANGIRSKNYRLNALSAPSIQTFKLVLDYPNYTGRSSEELSSTGNATFPEGTKATWEIEGLNTENIQLRATDTIESFLRNESENTKFVLSKNIYNDYSYTLSTSNKNVTDYEKLAYLFTVIRDAYPTLKIRQELDSLNPNISYYEGEASDDYKLKSIKLVYYADDSASDKQVVLLSNPNANFDRFYYTFPSGLDLDPGRMYSFYFTATDNDGIHQGKTTKSQVFSKSLLNKDQLRNEDLESQQTLIKNMGKSLDGFKEQKESLKEINQEQKEKEQMNFNDQNQVKEFLQKQQQQENLMQKFSKQLKENLEKGDKNDQMNKLLQERLERQELAAKKNEKLLDELNKIADKIDKDELTKRLEELGKKQQNSERSLEQLLELTKRYYVTEKASQLAKDLAEEAKRQAKLSELEIAKDYSDMEQQKLNQNFENLAKELDELKKDNDALQKPLTLSIDDAKKDEVKQDQKDALEDIKKHERAEESSQSDNKKAAAQAASDKQKSAAQKMKEMSEALEKSSEAGGGEESITEDAEMLRQILDNLITFSFKQENLYDSLEDADSENAQFSGSIRQQQELRELFGHVDDSLFSLSLRRAELSEFVNEQITEVYYNTDKALESMAENQIYQGVSYQKYVMNASNSLADFLANMLDNMQQSMMAGKGQGDGQDFQLPDIIKGQGELKEKMDGMGKKGQGKPQNGDGEGEKGEGQKGKGNKPGEGDSQSGEGGKEGKGKSGKNGDGNQGEGSQGEGSGKGGNGTGDGQEGPSESELQEIYEIYKEQQIIRQKLEQQLQDMINAGDKQLGQKLIKQMEDFENDLLENGVSQRSISKINNIQYELLKLENAALKQGQKSERESNTNVQDFKNPILSRPEVLEKYRNEIEILNRESLPLRPNFRNKVKDYFRSND